MIIVRLLSPEPVGWIHHHQLYSGRGADIVMESISLIEVKTYNGLLTTIFEVGDKIDGHPKVVRADVELLAHDSNREIPTCSKGGHRDRNQYNKKGQQAGRRQEYNSSVSPCEFSGRGTYRITQAHKRNKVARAGDG